MRSYLGSSAPAVDAGGWLDTGDLGFFSDGELFVTGRAKDVVIVRGANHPAEALEACVQGLPGVRRVVAGGFRSADAGGEALLLLVETRQPDDATLPGRVRAAVAERTGITPHAVCVLPPGTLPVTSSGKVRRAEAVRRFLQAELSPPPRRVAPELSVALLRSALGFARARLARRR